MGRKVHPVGYRLGKFRNWDSQWYADRDYTELVLEDVRIRDFVRKWLENPPGAQPRAGRRSYGAGISKIEIRRASNVSEISNTELDAYLVARNVAEQIERRVSFKRAMRMSADRTMRAWAEGVKIMVSGRLGGREMSRSEFEIRGRVPLQTLRADIDYGQTVASTTYGAIGVKAWVHRGASGRSRGEGPEGTEESGSRGSSE